MILVDTSVWIDHLRRGRPDLQTLLEDGRVHCHPFVIGELACGSMARRDEVIELLGDLPAVDIVEHDEAMRLLSTRTLYRTGIGWVDVHLLASALVSGAALWTLENRLAAAARKLRVAAALP